MNNSDSYSQNTSIKLELLPKVFVLSIFTSRSLAGTEPQSHNRHSEAVILCRFLNVLKIYCLVACELSSQAFGSFQVIKKLERCCDTCHT